MLIRVDRHRSPDLELWDRLEKMDRVHARSRRFLKRVHESTRHIAAFAAAGSCYAGMSWGKDSVCLAHLIATTKVQVPLVYVRVEPICNPHSDLVRDAFLAAHPHVHYDEIVVDCWKDDRGRLRAHGTIEQGFAKATERYGDRYISGVRGAESGQRTLRMRTHGISTERTCAPIGWWSGADVWAYLHAHELPVHPSYAMGLSSGWERDRIRVASLGMRRGAGAGKREWEMTFYRQELGRIFDGRDPRDLSD